MLPVGEQTHERLQRLRETKPPPEEWDQRIPLDPIRALMGETKDAEFEHRHPRDPHTGQFIGGGPSLEIPIGDFPLPTSAEDIAVDDVLRQETLDEYDRELEAGGDPGPDVPMDAPGYETWDKYLSPGGYQEVQDSARFNSRQGVGPSKIVAPLIDLIHERGLSRKGGEGWRMTTLDHLPPEARAKIDRGEPVTVKEPGFLSIGHSRVASEGVGEVTHPGGDLAELHVKIKTDRPALDVRQDPEARRESEMSDGTLVGEWNFEPNTRMRFTGEHHTEHRAIPYDPSISTFDIRDIEVYEVEVV